MSAYNEGAKIYYASENRVEVNPKRKKRTKEEIIANILKVAKQYSPATKTRIMRRCYMSYELLEKYLHQIIKCALLFYDHRSKAYHLTTKGGQFLERYHQYTVIEDDLISKRKKIANMLQEEEKER